MLIKTSTSSFTLSRRACLKGMGVAMALPFLEAMQRDARAQQAQIAKRVLFFYVPVGINMATFTPSETGRNFALSNMLEPLEPVRDRLLVLSGLENHAAFDQGDGGGDHARGTGAFITATHPLKSETRVGNGVSCDQIAAQAWKGKTRLSSLELGCEAGNGAGSCDIGYSCAYTQNISWASPTTPLAKEVNPRAVFDRLFAGADAGLTEEQKAVRKRRRLSVLDFVRGDTERLNAKLGARDRQKLDEFHTGVRELEVRINDAQSVQCAFPDRPAGASADPTTYIHQMMDLAVLAMKCDLTRAVTFMLGNGGSNRSFGFMGLPLGHHEYSHHQGKKESLDALAKIGRWEIEQLSYLAQQMDKIDEGGSTVLDNSLIYFSSEIEDGNSHSHTNMPVLLLGRAGGTINSGQHLRLTGDVGDVQLTMLQASGVDVVSFGEDGNDTIADILA